MRSVILSLLLASLPLAASAQMYKCTQPDGKVGFQDRPCQAGATGQQIEVHAPALIGDPGEAVKRNEAAAQQREFAAQQKMQEELAAERKEREAAPKRQQRCNRARYNLRMLQEQRPVYRNGNDGNRQYVEDSDRAAEIAEAQQVIRQNCD